MSSSQFDPTSELGELALRQCHLPLGYGGLGIPSASAISEPAYLGSIASVWHTLLDLIPDLRDLDIASPDSDRLPSLRDARRIHTRLLAEHASLRLRYKTFSEDKSSNPPFILHGLPKSLPTLSSLSSSSPPKAQSTFSRVVHHSAWRDLYNSNAEAFSQDRNLVRLVAVAQRGATDFHRAIPSRPDFAIDSEVMLFATQRQLGLPLSCLAGITDLPSDVDPYGDAAINSCSDHSTRHNHLTTCWAKALGRAHRRKVWQEYSLSSDCRADAAIEHFHGRNIHQVFETKLVSPLSSDGKPYNANAIGSAFAGSVPRMQAVIHAKYDGHLGRHRKTDLIHEVFGGISPPAYKFLFNSGCAMRSRDRHGGDPSDPESELPRTPDKDDSVPWAARSFLSSSLQAFSISIHTKVAEQVFAFAKTHRESHSRSRAYTNSQRGE